MSYCLDTSALLDAWVRYYSPDVVPSFWKNLDTLVDAGRVWACRQVLEELKRKDDDAHKWLKDRPQIIVEIDADRFKLAQAISDAFPNWVDGKRNGADPFIVALGEQKSWQVITGERLTKAINPRKMRIPDVCVARSVACGSLLEMMRSEKWRL